MKYKRRIDKLLLKAEERLAVVTLEDGSEYYINPEETQPEIFLYGAAVVRAMRTGAVDNLPEPPEVLSTISNRMGSYEERERAFRLAVGGTFHSLIPYDLPTLFSGGGIIHNTKPRKAEPQVEDAPETVEDDVRANVT